MSSGLRKSDPGDFYCVTVKRMWQILEPVHILFIRIAEYLVCVFWLFADDLIVALCRKEINQYIDHGKDDKCSDETGYKAFNVCHSQQL